MKLEGIHRFQACYLRDPAFRREVRCNGLDSVREALGLGKEEMALLLELDLDAMGRAAQGLHDERVGRRSSEFSQFITHLQHYIDLEGFWIGFDYAWPTGQMGRRAEIARFLSYAAEQLHAWGLPDYLLDLLRFNYHVTYLSEEPLLTDDDALAELPATGLLPHHEIALREPYEVVDFRCDVLSVASVAPEQMPGLPAQWSWAPVLLIKDATSPKTVDAYRLSEYPFFGRLLEGRNTVLEVVSQVPGSELGGALTILNALAERNNINVYDSGST